MNFSEQPPSNQWATLKYRGEPFAEAWFKPGGEPCALLFRIPRKSFHLPGLGQLLTAENLLKAVGIAAEEVAALRKEGGSQSEVDEASADLEKPLSPPPEDVTHLTLRVTLKPPTHPVAASESGGTSESEGGESEIPEEKWQELEARWNVILGIEASIDTLRISMESLRAEMDASSRRSLSTDEKLHALNADVAQWNKAKTLLLHALPKTKEFIHRSTWAAGSPDRKKLEEIFKNYIRPRIPFPELDKLWEQLESLLKDRQVLSAHGTAVYQECKGLSANVQSALRTLQNSARTNATKKRGAANR